MSVRDSLTGLSLLLTINLKTPKPFFNALQGKWGYLTGYMSLQDLLWRSQCRVTLRGYPFSDINLKPNKTLIFYQNDCNVALRCYEFKRGCLLKVHDFYQNLTGILTFFLCDWFIGNNIGIHDGNADGFAAGWQSG